LTPRRRWRRWTDHLQEALVVVVLLGITVNDPLTVDAIGILDEAPDEHGRCTR
jgi:hypothetical protein